MNIFKSRNINMTEGRPLHLMLSFAIPLMFGNVFQQLEEAYAQRREPVYTNGFYSETFFRGIEIYRVASILNRTPQGRVATPKAYRHMNRAEGGAGGQGSLI